MDSGVHLNHHSWPECHRDAIRAEQHSKHAEMQVYDKRFWTPRVEERARQELHILKKSTHANIVYLLDSFETNTSLVMVTELCTHGDLVKELVLKTSQENHLTVCARLKQVISAVLHIHRLVRATSTSIHLPHTSSTPWIQACHQTTAENDNSTRSLAVSRCDGNDTSIAILNCDLEGVVDMSRGHGTGYWSRHPMLGLPSRCIYAMDMFPYPLDDGPVWDHYWLSGQGCIQTVGHLLGILGASWSLG